jgi:putative ABC transport system permease protein
MARKSDGVAVLRCIGATSGQVFGIFLIQAAVMGAAGAALGVALGAGVQWILPRMLEGLLPVDVEIQLDRAAVITGMLVGLWTAVAFALLPLLQVRKVSPLTALRRRVEPIRLTGGDPARWIAWLILAASVLGLIVYQSGEPEPGIVIALGIGATLLVLWLTAFGAARLLRRLPRAGLAYTVRQGLANLHRPGNQTATVVLALGFGVFLIATLLLTQTNVVRTLAIETDTRGNLLLFDVQQDQVEGVEEILASRSASVVQGAAIVPMRVSAINGQVVLRPIEPIEPPEDFDDEFDDDEPGDDQNRRPPGGWAVRREYRSTYRDTINTSELLIAGRWWDPGRRERRDVYEVSLEREVAEELGVEIGDRIDWDVQGVAVPSVVSSIRQVDWARLEPNFFAVFEPAALLDAPQMWVFLTRAEDATERAMAQRDVVQRFPNVSVIDLTLVQRALDDVIGRVALAIRFLAGFSVATGFIVLIGAVATGRLQRIRESVLLKTLGATRRQIASILFTEYALLGLLGAVVGAGLAVAAAWGLARFLFDVPFTAQSLPLLAIGGAMALLSAIIGLSASRDVFRSTPMEAIREE